MSLPPPRAANKTGRQPNDPAWLPSAGLDYKRATLHEFVRVEEVPADTLAYANGPRSMRPGYAHIYKCTETGIERRWGIE